MVWEEARNLRDKWLKKTSLLWPNWNQFQRTDVALERTKPEVLVASLADNNRSNNFNTGIWLMS